MICLFCVKTYFHTVAGGISDAAAAQVFVYAKWFKPKRNRMQCMLDAGVMWVYYTL